MQNPKIIVVAGPTASGKTSLGIELALKFNGEIISADSRQIFRGLDVGSGKVKEYEKKGVPHHLIDILDPEQKYNVYKFQQDCLSLIQEISARGKLPIIVGGTGLYIQSVVERYQFTSSASIPPPGGGGRRPEGAAGRLRFSPLPLRDLPKGRNIDASSVQKLWLRPNTLVLNLNPERDVIKLNIQKRLISRWNDEGMKEEVQDLINSGVSKTWLKSLGLEYKFITQYLDGELSSEEELLTKLNTASWHFAKRQITFNKRWNYAHQIQTPEQALSLAKEFLV
jgi:tRNA dimethylallyltransferase